MMKCSVVILNWNGEQMLKRYLPSVVRHSALPDCEVVVADNGSTDGSLRLLRREFPSVRLITFRQNYGFAEGYNRALEQVDSTYTVLLNSDVEVTDGWLTPLIAYMDEHNDVAAVQPKILSDRDRTRFEHAGAAGGYLNRLGYPYCRGRILSWTAKDEGQYNSIVNVDWCSGACMCVRTKAYKEEGGLDASFFAHMEEIDLCWRLRRKGWKLACLPISKVYHLGGGSLDYSNPRKTYLNFRNNIWMLRKNLSHNRYIFVAAVRAILDNATAIVYLLMGRPAMAKAIWQARKDAVKS
ncbi:MAG: glycosyltransferase family 2 protein [Paludibacteraceae bacterium]|nr:glycosyltransferase family 2 protein [Paludibacteraceae bacterium]MBP5642211.1 glycosyltransferase family 2 protein [Paludibacteraceae bacterium]